MRVYKSTRSAAALILLGLAGGCSCSSDPGVRRLMDSLPIASSIGNARGTSGVVRENLSSTPGIAESDKADLRARAEILAAHADRLDNGMEIYTSGGGSVSKKNLTTRAAALDTESLLLMRELSVWKVKHGLVPASDIFEFVEPGQLLD